MRERERDFGWENTAVSCSKLIAKMLIEKPKCHVNLLIIGKLR